VPPQRHAAGGVQSNNAAAVLAEINAYDPNVLHVTRLGLNLQGNQALRTCLPRERFAALMAASAEPSRAVTFIDHRLRRLLSIDLSHPRRFDPANRERPISRIALDVVHFGRKFVAYEEREAGVVATFEDRSTDSGTVLIGADGAGSRVRAQLLPQARRVDMGIVIISGKLTLTPAVRAAIPPPFLLGPTLILGPPGMFMFANAVRSGPKIRGQVTDSHRGAAATRTLAGLA
jgi:hypothetical protein